MSKQYYRNEAMVTGGPFKCPNCKKTLAIKLTGTVYEAQFECPRCKTVIDVKCKEPIPFVAEKFPYVHEDDLEKENINA